jgi:hypothetical protein
MQRWSAFNWLSIQSAHSILTRLPVPCHGRNPWLQLVCINCCGCSGICTADASTAGPGICGTSHKVEPAREQSVVRLLQQLQYAAVLCFCFNACSTAVPFNLLRPYANHCASRQPSVCRAHAAALVSCFHAFCDHACTAHVALAAASCRCLVCCCRQVVCRGILANAVVCRQTADVEQMPYIIDMARVSARCAERCSQGP